MTHNRLEDGESLLCAMTLRVFGQAESFKAAISWQANREAGKKTLARCGICAVFFSAFFSFSPGLLALYHYGTVRC